MDKEASDTQEQLVADMFGGPWRLANFIGEGTQFDTVPSSAAFCSGRGARIRIGSCEPSPTLDQSPQQRKHQRRRHSKHLIADGTKLSLWPM